MKKYFITALAVLLFGGSYYIVDQYSKNDVNQIKISVQADTANINTAPETILPPPPEKTTFPSTPRPTNKAVQNDNGELTAGRANTPIPNKTHIPSSPTPTPMPIILSTLSPAIINTPIPSQADAATPLPTILPTQNKGTKAAFNFTLPDLDGNNITLNDYKGKKVILVFWTTWCPSCRAELPAIEKIYQKYKNENIVVLGINYGEDKSIIKSFMDKNDYSFQVLLDSDKNIGQIYKIPFIPSTYFINEQGTLVFSKYGTLTADKIEADIAAMDE